MKALKATWKTLTDTLRIVGQSSNYGLYPLLSFIIILLVSFSLMIPLLNRALAEEEALMGTFLFLEMYAIYGVLHFVTTFFNVALVSSLAGQLDGEAPPLSRGLSTALQRTGPITRYTLVSVTLSLVSILTKKLFNSFFGGVIAPLISKRLWLRWRKLSHTIPLLMAVPVMALDQPLPESIFQRSELLVKETWGERVKPAHSIGLLALLILLPIILLFTAPALQQGAAEGNAGLLRLGSSILVVSLLTFTQMNGLVKAIFGLAAYRFATAGKSDVFPGDVSYGEQAFVKPKKETDEGAALTASIPGSPSAIADDLSN